MVPCRSVGWDVVEVFIYPPPPFPFACVAGAALPFPIPNHNLSTLLVAPPGVGWVVSDSSTVIQLHTWPTSHPHLSPPTPSPTPHSHPLCPLSPCWQIAGTFKGASATGLGFVERNNFARMTKVDNFLKTVGYEVRRELDDFYPHKMTQEAMAKIFVPADKLRYLEGVPLDIVESKMIAPIRGITDRGGKSWRSYSLLAWCVFGA
jgi:hypothetical protein